MAVEDAFDIFGSDPFGRDYLYGLSTGRDGQGLAPYGFRYAESVNQPTTTKGRGYLGNVGTMQDPMTELSASSDFGGRTVQYPLIVPTLTADELNLLRSGGEPTQEIYGKAQQYALGRLSRGQDPFATTQELRYPQPQAVDTRPYDQMQATPRGFTSGLFSDVFGRTLNMPSIPRTGIPALDLLYMNRNPVLNMMGVGDVQKTAERISYGQPLTTGSGMTLKPREEAVFAGMAVAPFVGEAVNLGARAGRAGARMVGQGMAENVAMGRPNLPSMLAEPRSSLFAVEPSALMPKPQAPVSELGFYSAAEQAALNLPRNKGTGQSFLNDLMKAPDVKKDELSWIGLDDFLKDKPNVTKQEVQDFIASNKIDLQEVQLSGKGEKSAVFTEFNPDKNKFIVYGNDLTIHGSFNTNQEAINFSREYNSKIPYAPSKYDKYQLAGGENYREILLKIPENMSEYNKYTDSLRAKYGQGGFANLPLTDIERARLEKFYANEDVRPYQSSHFNDPNILAHIRVNDRIDADGKKMLLVEELQSDWHQAGRERGYASKESLEKWYNQNKLESDPVFSNLNSEQIRTIERNRSAGMGGESVPDAPFKDTWYQLSLKRILKYAADNGYERVGLTTGKQQAKRYDLGNEVNSIDVESVEGVPNLQLVDIDVIGGQKIALEVENGVVREGEFAGKRLSDVVGKEMADKITNVAQGKTKSLAGEDLRLGGEGMKKYYDEIYPKFLEKYGKKWDAGVGDTKVNTVKERAENSMIPIMGQEPVRYIDITPKMKEGVKKGQPLAAAEQTPEMLASGGLDYADPFRNPLLESSIG
jgi:hypothetical protein